jgi:hypothetical protein
VDQEGSSLMWTRREVPLMWTMREFSLMWNRKEVP